MAIGNGFLDVQKRYPAIVSSCFVQADGSRACYAFFDGRTKCFKSPEKAEEHILRKYKNHII